MYITMLSTKASHIISKLTLAEQVQDTELIGGLTVENAVMGIAKDNP